MPSKDNTKSYIHPRSYHRGLYDYTALTKSNPKLAEHVITNKANLPSINYTDAKAVVELNKALLLNLYDLEYWELPEDYLCPAVPGRAEYIHHIADLLGSFNDYKYPAGKNITCLDIGTGANCIYPIIGRKVYKWSFIGTEINEQSFKSAKKIVSSNQLLKDKVDLRQQKDSKLLMTNILKKDEFVDVVICNPPFFESAKAAKEASIKKSQALNKTDKWSINAARNFRGQHSELWCEGGELNFVRKMISESAQLRSQCFIYTSLVSKSKNLEKLTAELDKHEVTYTSSIQLALGNKKSNLLVWTFLTPKQRKVWAKSRWG